MAQIKEGHLIIPPTDEALRGRLVLKLEEYQERIAGKGEAWEYWHPEQAHLLSKGYRDACYKAHVLDAVLKSETLVDAWKLCHELREKWKKAFNLKDFCNACGVVEKYCGNLPDEPFLSKGTGLPELPKNVDS